MSTITRLWSVPSNTYDDGRMFVCRCHLMGGEPWQIADAIAVTTNEDSDCERCEEAWHWGVNPCVCGMC